MTESTPQDDLPPGADPKDREDEIPGTAGWDEPSEDAPGEGRLAPDGDNVPPDRTEGGGER